MDHVNAITMSASQEVLGIEKGGAAAFVKQKLHDRELHVTVIELNNAFLFGNPVQREEARQALHRLGFAEI